MNFVYRKLFSLALMLFVLQLWSLPSLAADANEIQRLVRRIDNLELTLGERIRDLEEKLARIAPIVDQHERRMKELYKRPPSRPFRVPPVRRPSQRGYIQ